MSNRGRRDWVPDRREIIWIDCDPQAGREMKSLHPLLVLSPRAFNARTSLVIGVPMSTADSNADNPFAVIAGQPQRSQRARTSYVLCHQPKSFDWRARRARPHPMRQVDEATFVEVLQVLNQIMQLA